MSKTTFLERFQKVNKFFDNVYHHHKATYKGMAQFFQNYAEIQKKYSTALLEHSQTSISCIPDLKKQQPSVQNGIKQICINLQTVSQLHYNMSERLREMSQYYREQYLGSKKKKERFMRDKFTKSEEMHSKAKAKRDRNLLEETQKQICRDLYEAIDEYMDDELARTHKLKEQMVIYFSIIKKIAEKKIELSSTNNIKMAQFEVWVKVNQVEAIEEIIIDQFNGYGQHQRLISKNRQINKEIAVHRQSLRQSVLRRQRASKFQQNVTILAKVLAKYKVIPEELNYPEQEQYLVGIFDKRVIPQYKKFSRQFKSQALRQISFAWLTSHFSDSGNEQALSLLTIAKVNMKVKQVKLSKTKNIQEFVNKIMTKGEQSHKNTLWFIVQISQIYEGNQRLSQLEKKLSDKNLVKKVPQNIENPIHWKIILVILDCLLDSTIVISADYSVLYDEYVQILQLIITFAKATFNIPASIIITMFLRKFKRVLEVTCYEERQRVQDLISTKIDYTDEFSQTEELKMHLCHRIIHFLTEKMSTFYKNFIDFSNLVKLSLMVQKVLPKNYFQAIEHMHACIRIAGFNFFEDSDEDFRVTQGLWNGQERLKNLTIMLEQLQIDKVIKNYLVPMAKELSKILGVGYDFIIDKMRKNFSTAMFQIVQCSLNLLNQQEGVDRQGFALRLGIKLALIDIQIPQPITYYNVYLTVLEKYLSLTEKDYDKLLDQARKTELWMVEDNNQATQNCIDFCSLLYKPFQFLLISLQKLEEEHEQTEFTKKYSDFIKLKLNNALKGQIQKYLKSLVDSLRNFVSTEPNLSLKYKRMGMPIQEPQETLIKERYLFREVTRRLFNLIFLKDQLNELVCDFIDKDIFKELNRSIFHLSELQTAASSHPLQQKMLLNIHSIAQLVDQTQKQLIKKIANITVFHFMRRIFLNIYYQEEKGFFSSDSDYKLSEYNLLKYQSELEELFLNISRNMPGEVLQKYSIEFCKSLYKAYRVEVLDSNKFKIPIKQQKIISYLEADLNFFCNLAKQKFMRPECVKEHFQDPSFGILRDIQKNSQKLMESFSEANVKQDKQQAKYYLAILNLRKDSKAEDFVEKYKKFIK